MKSFKPFAYLSQYMESSEVNLEKGRVRGRAMDLVRGLSKEMDQLLAGTSGLEEEPFNEPQQTVKLLKMLQTTQNCLLHIHIVHIILISYQCSNSYKNHQQLYFFIFLLISLGDNHSLTYPSNCQQRARHSTCGLEVQTRLRYYLVYNLLV